MNALNGRVALVTGGTSGIGRAIALALHEAGAHVMVTTRQEDFTPFPRFVTMKLELDPAVPAHFERLKSLFESVAGNRLDILVNNIGSALGFKRFDELTDDDWLESFQVNLMSMVRFTRAALPYLEKSLDGRIVNIASLAGKRPGRMNPHYGAMKAAMIHYSKHLSNELAEKGITVNAVAPHTVRGGAWERDVRNKAQMEGISEAEASAKLAAEVTAKMPLKRIILPEEVAQMVVYLASDAARTVTGQCFVMDGGVANTMF